MDSSSLRDVWIALAGVLIGSISSFFISAYSIRKNLQHDERQRALAFVRDMEFERIKIKKETVHLINRYCRAIRKLSIACSNHNWYKDYDLSFFHDAQKKYCEIDDETRAFFDEYELYFSDKLRDAIHEKYYQSSIFAKIPANSDEIYHLDDRKDLSETTKFLDGHSNDLALIAAKIRDDILVIDIPYLAKFRIK